MDARVSPEWAAWPTASRPGTRLPRHFPGRRVLAPGRQHPAVVGRGPARRFRPWAGATYSGPSPPLTRSRSTSSGHLAARPQIDHVAHLGPSVAAGLGTSRAATRRLPGDRPGAAHDDGQPGSPARARSPPGRPTRRLRGKVAIEAVDRAMRAGLAAPIYEGEDGVIAWLLDGPDLHGAAPRPRASRNGRSSNLYEGAFGRVPGPGAIDLARRLRTPNGDRRRSRVVIHTSHHTHNVIGTGSSDPQKFDPAPASETLDHSLPTSSPSPWQDGTWDHERILRARARAGRTPSNYGARSPRSRTRVDPALPRPGPAREGLRRPGRDHPDGRDRDHRRDRGGGRPSLGRATVCPARVRRTSSGRSPATCVMAPMSPGTVPGRGPGPQVPRARSELTLAHLPGSAPSAGFREPNLGV